MQIQFNTPYRSITEFDPVDIPKFVVLTGLNGTGKTHLLEAIVHQNVVITGTTGPPPVLISGQGFQVGGESVINSKILSVECEDTWNNFEKHYRGNIKKIREELVPNYEIIKAQCKARKESLLNSTIDGLKQYQQRIKSLFYSSRNKPHPNIQAIYALAKTLPYSIDEISKKVFFQLFKPVTQYRNDLLPTELGRIVWDYYVKDQRNQFNEFRNEKYEANNEVLSEEKFISVYGEKPWEVINEILNTFDSLPYRVNSPEGLDPNGSFQLKLVHREKDYLEINFGQLSSGETILLGLVGSVYNSSTDKQFPNLLLLDEVDGSLHPSMMEKMLEVIDRVFLQYDVKVILVTHAPTTIAMAPEDSIYVMNRTGRNRIEKKSRQEALSILTQGFATIEQGLKLFDEVARHSITIITEGRNTLLIRKALELNGVNDVGVLPGVEGITGKNQLETIFDFLSRTHHENKIIFVWDCDANPRAQPSNNTYPYTLPHNSENTIAKKGIENIFPASLFDNFTKQIIRPGGRVIIEFDEGEKRNFESFVIDRNNVDDFRNFSSLVSEIERVREL